MVWDGLPAHWGTDVRTFLSDGAARRLHLEQLPGYAPNLNPDEGGWNCRRLHGYEDFPRLQAALEEAIPDED